MGNHKDGLDYLQNAFASAPIPRSLPTSAKCFG